MMLTKLIDLCLENRWAVILLTVAMAWVGVHSFTELEMDAFPDTTPIQVQVNTVAPALGPLEIERQVTFPIEQTLSGLPGLVEMRSVSRFGFSQIVVIFERDMDIFTARQVTSEKLADVMLPGGSYQPTLGPLATGLGEVFQYIVKSDTLSPMELRTLHHWVIRPQMLQVPGVAEINTWGGFEKEYHVVIDPSRLYKYQLSLDDVARVVERASRNVGGASIDSAGESVLVAGLGLATAIEDLESTVVAMEHGTPVLLRDVAEVKIGHQIRRGAATADGEGEAILGLGFMLMGENSREVAQALETRLREVQKTIPDTVELKPVYNRTDLVDTVLETVRNNLLAGALLVIAILFMFLGNIRAGLIVALAIPLSLLFAAHAMLKFGIAGSLMSLGAIDFGLVVDSSVIMVENSERRLAEDDERSVTQIVRDASIEVRKPTLFGELIITVVYLPILFLEGVEGELFRPMALTVIFALVGSMILSVTLVPVLASLLLKKRQHLKEPWLIRGLKKLYRPALAFAIEYRNRVILLAFACVFSAGAIGLNLGTEFVPQLREQALVINTVRIAGVSLEESVNYGTEIEKLLLREFPDEIAHIWTRTGTAEVATDPMGLEVSDVFITLHPRQRWTRASTQDELESKMSGVMEGLPGMRSIFSQPIELRVAEMMAGIRTDVGVKIFGDDLEQLATSAEDVVAILESIPGAADVSMEQLTGQSVLAVKLDRVAAGRFGVQTSEILDFIQTLGGIKAAELVEGEQVFDVVIRLDTDLVPSADQVATLLVPTASGARVPLSALAEISMEEGPSAINREWAERRVIVQANVRGRDLGGFVKELDSRLKELELPPGYYTRIDGEYRNLERAQKRLFFVIPVAFLLVFMLLFITYGRLADTLRVFTGVPFAAVGGVVALWLRDLPFSISAAVGFIALSGVAVLGDMVLVSRIRDELAHGKELLDAVKSAAETRLRPVLMTALVAALGFLPMALNTGIGAEVQRPLATVLVGGMLTSTVATLLVLPLLYIGMYRGPKS